MQEFCHKVKTFFCLDKNGIHKRSYTKICLRFCHNFKTNAGQTCGKNIVIKIASEMPVPHSLGKYFQHHEI